jgi:hypothetical protein
MAVSMYEVSVPVFVRHLTGLAVSLERAQALYAEKKYDEATLLNYRLYPDMFNFAKQVQAATNHAVTCSALLAGKEIPKFDDNEKSLADLLARVQRAVAFLNGLKPADLEGAEAKDITLKRPTGEEKFKGLGLFLDRSEPNFYFHATTAYDILRHNGVELGKRHFMGKK